MLGDVNMLERWASYIFGLVWGRGMCYISGGSLHFLSLHSPFMVCGCGAVHISFSSSTQVVGRESFQPWSFTWQINTEIKMQGSIWRYILTLIKMCMKTKNLHIPFQRYSLRKRLHVGVNASLSRLKDNSSKPILSCFSLFCLLYGDNVVAKHCGIRSFMSSHSEEDTYTYCMSLRDTSAGLKLEEKRLEIRTTIERLETVTVKGSVSGVFESHN